MPCTFSIVLSTQNNGAICTRPPMETTISTPISRIREFFSKTSCRMGCLLGRRADRERVCTSGRGWLGGVRGNIPAHGTPDVVGHDQGTGDEQQTADRTNDIVGMHGL